MSQSVNHGEKSVSSTGDTVEPVEAIGPSQPTSAEPGTSLSRASASVG